MKLAATLLLMLSATAVGCLLSEKPKLRAALYAELIQLCDLLMLDIGFRNTPITQLLSDCRFRRLGFITAEAVKTRSLVSPLPRDENASLCAFLYALGTSDAASQLQMIEGYRAYCIKMQEKYASDYIKNARVCISLGFFCGAVLSLVML